MKQFLKHTIRPLFLAGFVYIAFVNTVIAGTFFKKYTIMQNVTIDQKGNLPLKTSASHNFNVFIGYHQRNVPAISQTKDSIGIIELRNYVMKSGKRDTFIDFFEKNYVTSQDTLHGHILGRYRVSGKNDNFCWIRGFENMHARSVFLPAFYHGPVWRQTRNEANSMLANNDNVYLLKPMTLQGDSLVASKSVSSASLAPHKGITVVDFYVANSKLPHLLKLFSRGYQEKMRASGFNNFSVWTSEMQFNDFPQLPVFQDKNLLVVISFFESESAYLSAAQRLKDSLPDDLKTDFDDTITTKNTWVLSPTEKSLK